LFFFDKKKTKIKAPENFETIQISQSSPQVKSPFTNNSFLIRFCNSVI